MADMLDDLLNVGSAFDWISPIAGWIGQKAKGLDAVAFQVPPGLTDHDVRDVLHEFGVRTGYIHGAAFSSEIVMNVSNRRTAEIVIQGLWDDRIEITRSRWNGRVSGARWR